MKKNKCSPKHFRIEDKKSGTVGRAGWIWLKTLENDFKRVEKLYSEGAVSTKEFEEAKTLQKKQ